MQAKARLDTEPDVGKFGPWEAGWSQVLLVAPVKGPARMAVKVREYASEEGVEWGTSRLGDILRATVVCRDGHAIRSVWEGLQREFGIAPQVHADGGR